MGKKRTTMRKTKYIIVKRNVIEAPCEEAILMGFFSLKFTKMLPIAKFSDTRVSVTKKVFTEEAKVKINGYLKCEKKLIN